MALLDDIESFTAEHLPETRPLDADPQRRKAIHDNVWGTQILDPWEIDLLDTALMQRLRGVRQTGIAHLTFPSASQTRFEHTLGVLHIATTIFDELRQRAKPEHLEHLKPIERIELRLAALLHDVGHGVFSHASEALVRADAEVMQAIRDAELVGGGPYEAFSFFIVQSSAFANFVERLKTKYPRTLNEVDPKRVADLIAGRASPERDYLSSIMSGPFDADKLDYIARDSRASGVELVVDLPRLLYAMGIDWVEDEGTHSHIASAGEGRLALYMRSNASAVLEQTLFAKIQLFIIVYHHGKVRAAEALARGALNILIREGLINTIDLLRLTDESFTRMTTTLLTSASGITPDVDRAIRQLINRELPQRAAVLTRGTYSDPDRVLNRAIGNRERILFEQELGRRIREAAGLEHELDVLVDLPPLPPLSEAARSAVLMTDNYTVASMNTTFPSEDWLQTYVVKKWKGHVFGPSERGKKKAVFDAAVEVFADTLNIEIDDAAAVLAHVGT